MARVVVVASSEPKREALAAVLEPEDDLHVVVPAVEQSRLQWLVNDEDEARDRAEGVADAVAEAAPTDPASLEVKPDLPAQAVLDAIAEHRPDRIVFALRDGEEATWLEEGQLDVLADSIEGVPLVRVSL